VNTAEFFKITLGSTGLDRARQPAGQLPSTGLIPIILEIIGGGKILESLLVHELSQELVQTSS